MTYKGYTIEPSTHPIFGGFEFFPEEGRQDDYDLVGEDYKYCGNVEHASTIEEAKDMIDEKVMMAMPPWFVYTQGPAPVSGIERLGQLHITKFTWLSDALKFSYQFNGQLTTQFNCP